MANEVVIIVRAKNDTKAVFERIRADARKLGDDMGEDVTVHFTEKIKRESANSGGDIAKIGDVMGKTIGVRVAEQITERIKVDVSERLRDSRGRFISGGGDRTTINNSYSNRDRTTIKDGGGNERVHVSVDVDKQSLMQRLASFGKEAGEKFGNFFQDGWKETMSNIFSGDIISTILKGVTVAGVAAVLAPVLGAAVDASIMTVLGGGAIAIGVVGALKDPRIKTAIKGVKTELGHMLDDFSANFKGPLENFLASPNKSKTGGKTGLQGILDQIKPQVDSLGKTMGEATDKLLNQGLTGLLQNALPGILRAMQSAKPFIDTLSDKMPGIGKAIGKFFDIISNNSAGAQLFLSDFLNLLEKIIPMIGAIIGGFSNMYLSIREFFAKLRVAGWEWASGFLEAADAAFGWIPGLGGKLDAAKKKVHKFANDANKDLKNIHDVDVEVRFHAVWGNIWSQVGKLLALKAQAGGGKSKSSGMGGKASGGVTGSGLTWVGEEGPELAAVPAGTKVYSHGDSMRMAGAGGGESAQPMIVQLVLDGMVLAQKMIDPQREIVRRRYGGNVQSAYGGA